VSNITIKDLSSDQLAAYNAIMSWIGDRTRQPLLSLGGFAGSGKSTLVSLVAKQVDLPAFCAYTGKATSVLRRKLHAAGTETVGTQKKSRDGEMSHDERPYCGTIHSLIYRPCDCLTPQTVDVLKPCPVKDCPGETRWAMPLPGAAPSEGQSVCAKGHTGLVKTRAAFEALKPKKVFVYVEKVDGRCKLCGGKEWIRREALDRNYGLIIVDEASMVDDMMLRDLREYGVPILAVGDHGQLPPVGGVGSLMKAPHLRLEKIHRQAEGNPIIALSKLIRETGRLPESMPEGDVTFDKLRFVEQLIEKRYGDASATRLLEMGLACYTNKRRVGLNVAVRRVRGTARSGRELPRAGEHVICLRNMKGEQGRPPVANGMRGVLQSDATPKQIVNMRGEKVGMSETQLTGSIAFPEDEIVAHSYDMLGAQFGREKTFSSPEELARDTGLHSFAMAGALFDYGFAMTVHKMQGSQFDDLVVCAERPGPVDEESWRRWLYTAVTRAAKKLTVLR
jgi:exodeoxyribonuclease-5